MEKLYSKQKEDRELTVTQIMNSLLPFLRDSPYLEVLISFLVSLSLRPDSELSDGKTLYSQQKQDQELTVAQTMNSLLPNSDLN